MDRIELEGLTRGQLMKLALEAGIAGAEGMADREVFEALLARGSGTPSNGFGSADPASTGAPDFVELSELPESYGRTRLTLMEVEPYWIYAYWEILPEDRKSALEALKLEGAKAHWVLRFYDVTWIDFEGGNAHGFFDVPIDAEAGNWYVNLWSSDKTYCAEAGLRSPDGRFVAVTRSNSVHIPRPEPSPHYDPKWSEGTGKERTEQESAPPSAPFVEEIPVAEAKIRNSPGIHGTAPPLPSNVAAGGLPPGRQDADGGARPRDVRPSASNEADPQPLRPSGRAECRTTGVEPRVLDIAEPRVRPGEEEIRRRYRELADNIERGPRKSLRPVRAQGSAVEEPRGYRKGNPSPENRGGPVPSSGGSHFSPEEGSPAGDGEGRSS